MKKVIFMICAFMMFAFSTSFAYYADTTSAVNLGMVKSYSRSAINVVDDDGNIYTFIYDNRPGSDLGFWKLQDEENWHQWEFGPQQKSHMEDLASCGFYALKDLGKL